MKHALVVVALLLVSACTALSGPVNRPTAKPSAQATTDPKALAGMRLLGVGGAAVSVPADWPSVSLPPCAWAAGNSVNFAVGDRWLTHRCGAVEGSPAGSAVVVAALDSSFGRLQMQNIEAASGLASTPLDTGTGIDAVSSEPTCLGTPDLCLRPLALPETNSLFLVQWRGEDDAFFRQVMRSLQLLPDGYTTVPFIRQGESGSTAERLLKIAGLVAQLPVPTSPYYVVRTEPPAGAVVAKGTTVRVFGGDG